MNIKDTCGIHAAFVQSHGCAKFQNLKSGTRQPSGVRNKLSRLLTGDPRKNIHSSKSYLRTERSPDSMESVCARVKYREKIRTYTFSRGDATTGMRCKKTDKETHCRLNAAGTHLAWMEVALKPSRFRCDCHCERLDKHCWTAKKKKHSGWQR